MLADVNGLNLIFIRVHRGIWQTPRINFRPKTLVCMPTSGIQVKLSVQSCRPHKIIVLTSHRIEFVLKNTILFKKEINQAWNIPKLPTRKKKKDLLENFKRNFY